MKVNDIGSQHTDYDTPSCLAETPKYLLGSMQSKPYTPTQNYDLHEA